MKFISCLAIYLTIVSYLLLVVSSEVEWDKLFEKSSDSTSVLFEPAHTHELLKQLADNPSEQLNKKRAAELVSLCDVSERLWTLKSFLDKCYADQVRLCTKELDSDVKNILDNFEADSRDAIELLMELRKTNQLGKALMVFSQRSGLKVERAFELCAQLTEILKSQLTHYRWLKDNDLEYLLSEATHDWLTKGEHCHYMLNNRGSIYNEKSTKSMQLDQAPTSRRGRFQDSRGPQVKLV